jgi:hypothetical protein
MKSLNSADGMMALKHSLKKELAHYKIKKGKGVHSHATRACGGTVPVIFNFGTMWVREVTFTFRLLYTQHKSFRCALNVTQISVWANGRTNEYLTTTET